MTPARPVLGSQHGAYDMVAKADGQAADEGLLEFFRQCWLGGTGISYTDPQVSVLHSDLAGLAPTSQHWG